MLQLVHDEGPRRGDDSNSVNYTGSEKERTMNGVLRDKMPFFGRSVEMKSSEAPSPDQLETFPNPRPGRDYSIEIICPEFTSVCPVTCQPDFGTIVFDYTPEALCVELKSLKLYLQRFRNQGIFYEAVTNQLLDDFVKAIQPRRLTITSKWTPRGGITTNVTVKYERG
jgi:7-cyano-7-deazaguanine reductase